MGRSVGGAKAVLIARILKRGVQAGGNTTSKFKTNTNTDINTNTNTSTNTYTNTNTNTHTDINTNIHIFVNFFASITNAGVGSEVVLEAIWWE